MRSILTKSMKDSVVRGCLLQLLYERRSEGSIPFGHSEQAIPPPAGISRRDWLRAVAQLSEYRLIDWTPLEDKSGMGLLSGFAKINDFGVKVLEAGAASPIRISIDESRRTTVPRQEQAPIAASTPQQQAITKALEKVITAINQADVSEKEKNEAKSLLRQLLGSKAAGSMLGASAQSPRREVFHGIERYIDFKVALDQGPIGKVRETCEIVRSSDKKNRKKLPCLLKSTPTPSAGNRFTATGGSNIPNGSSHLASPPCASWNCSTLSRERNPTSL